MSVDEDEVTQMVQRVQNLGIKLQDLLPANSWLLGVYHDRNDTTEYWVEKPGYTIMLPNHLVGSLLKLKLVVPDKPLIDSVTVYVLTPLGHAVAQTLQLIAEIELTNKRGSDKDVDPRADRVL